MWGGQLVAVGPFRLPSGATYSGVARWNGATWGPIGSGIFSGVYFVDDFDGRLVIGGDFGQAGVSNPARNVAMWDGLNWVGLSSGVDLFVAAMHSAGADLFVGGSFREAFGRRSSAVASWGRVSSTSAVVQESVPNPSLPGQPVTLVVRVTGHEAPQFGGVTFTAVPSGSCTDVSMTPISPTMSEASCTLTFRRPGVQEIRARYDGEAVPGAIGHSPSVSAVYAHSVVGFDEVLLRDQFEGATERAVLR
jgi:hypothetical protein